jgi:hypothetical protein
MTETYSLILNSQTTTNITDNTSLSAYQYNIRWDSILPRHYQRYSVDMQLKSANVLTASFVGSASASLLTITTMLTGNITVGMQYINSSNQLVTISSFGTGTGQTGTYNINSSTTTASTVIYSINSTLTNNIICSVNFGYTTLYEQNNSQSTKIGTIYPYQYNINQNIYASNLNCSALDNNPIQIGYPSNQIITVKFLNLDGSTFSQMPHYYLQLYFTPILN